MRKTIDNFQQRQINAEKQHTNAFWGLNNTVYTKNNGKLLGLIEMIYKFDMFLIC
jgi:hypothetical protein